MSYFKYAALICIYSILKSSLFKSHLLRTFPLNTNKFLFILCLNQRYPISYIPTPIHYLHLFHPTQSNPYPLNKANYNHSSGFVPNPPKDALLQTQSPRPTQSHQPPNAKQQPQPYPKHLLFPLHHHHHHHRPPFSPSPSPSPSPVPVTYPVAKPENQSCHSHPTARSSARSPSTSGLAIDRLVCASLVRVRERGRSSRLRRIIRCSFIRSLRSRGRGLCGCLGNSVRS